MAVDLVPIISAVSLHLDQGECLGIQGPNGAGKTTLLRVIATLLTPTGGTGIGSRGPTRDRAEIPSVRPEIGLAGHVPALAGPLSLIENLLLVARLSGRSQEEAAAAALARVGLAGAAGSSGRSLLPRNAAANRSGPPLPGSASAAPARRTPGRARQHRPSRSSTN